LVWCKIKKDKSRRWSDRIKDDKISFWSTVWTNISDLCLNKLYRDRSHDGDSLKIKKLTSASQLVKQMKILQTQLKRALNKLYRDRSHDGDSLKIKKLTSAGQLVKQMKIL